jgi:hypothetical protein
MAWKAEDIVQKPGFFSLVENGAVRSVNLLWGGRPRPPPERPSAGVARTTRDIVRLFYLEVPYTG